MFCSVDRFLHSSSFTGFFYSGFFLFYFTLSPKSGAKTGYSSHVAQHGGTVEPAIIISFMSSLPFQPGLNFYIALLKVSSLKTRFSHQQV